MSSPSPIIADDALRPWQSIQSGWQAIQPQYWFFFLINLLVLLISSAVPLVLVGPCYCGMYYCLFKRMRGETVVFEDLLKGFDVFVESLWAVLLQMAVVVAVVGGLALAVFAVTLLGVTFQLPSGNPVLGLLMIAGVLLGILLMMAVILILRIGFMFALPAVIDRKLKAFDAIHFSFQLARQHWGRLIVLQLLLFLLMVLGMLACYVGLFFAMPVAFAAEACAYRKLCP